MSGAPIAFVAVTLVLVAMTHSILHAPTGGAAPIPTLHSVVPPDFEASAFDRPSTAARMTKAQAVDTINRTYWSLDGVSNIVGQYVGWTPSDGLPRPAPSSPTQGNGHRDIWKITAPITTTDPGGRAGAAGCESGATGATCPGLRVYHYMVFLVDDKTGEVIEASPY